MLGNRHDLTRQRVRSRDPFDPATEVDPVEAILFPDPERIVATEGDEVGDVLSQPVTLVDDQVDREVGPENDHPLAQGRERDPAPGRRPSVLDPSRSQQPIDRQRGGADRFTVIPEHPVVAGEQPGAVRDRQDRIQVQRSELLTTGHRLEGTSPPAQQRGVGPRDEQVAADLEQTVGELFGIARQDLHLAFVPTEDLVVRDEEHPLTRRLDERDLVPLTHALGQGSENALETRPSVVSRFQETEVTIRGDPDPTFGVDLDRLAQTRDRDPSKSLAIEFEKAILVSVVDDVEDAPSILGQREDLRLAAVLAKREVPRERGAGATVDLRRESRADQDQGKEPYEPP